MIWLSLVAFVVTALAAGMIARWMSGHASMYGNGMPQRFHLGDVPRLGGAAVLLGLGCDTGQGYHFSRPVPAADLQGLLTQGHAVLG